MFNKLFSNKKGAVDAFLASEHPWISIIVYTFDFLRSAVIGRISNTFYADIHFGHSCLLSSYGYNVFSQLIFVVNLIGQYWWAM